MLSSGQHSCPQSHDGFTFTPRRCGLKSPQLGHRDVRDVEDGFGKVPEFGLNEPYHLQGLLHGHDVLPPLIFELTQLRFQLRIF